MTSVPTPIEAPTAAVVKVPSIDATTTGMNALRRSAEADFHFANIWEHRQLRKVMIAGFQTLGEALKHLEESVLQSSTASRPP